MWTRFLVADPQYLCRGLSEEACGQGVEAVTSYLYDQWRLKERLLRKDGRFMIDGPDR